MIGMLTSSEIGELVLALSIVQGKVEGAVKSSTNPHFKSKYSDLSEVWNACREHLAAQSIAVIQTPSIEGSDSYLETIVAHKSGQWIKGKMKLINNKGDMQGLGSAITYARRYSLAAMVGIASEDDDANAASVQKPVLSIQKPVQAPIKNTPNTSVAVEAKPFDPNNEKHQNVLKVFLDKKKASGFYKTMLEQMKGKPATLNAMMTTWDIINPDSPPQPPEGM